MMADVFLYYIVPAVVIINTVIFVFVSFDFFKANRAGKKVENFKNACADFLDKLDVFLKEVKKCPANIIEAVSPAIDSYIRERAEYYFNEMMRAELKTEPVVNGTEVSLEDVVFDNSEQENEISDIVEVPAATGVDFRELEKSAFIEKLLKVKEYRDRFLTEVVRVPVKESRAIRISNRNADLIQRLVYHTEIPITVVEVLNNILNEHFQRNSEEVTHIIEDMPEYHQYDFES